MDDETRNNGTETDKVNESSDRNASGDGKKRRSPSQRSERSRSRSRRRSRDSRSKSRSRDRNSRRRRSRSRSKSRGFSPDRRRRPFNNRGGGFYRDYYNNRRRRSPSDRRSPLRNRNNRGRRSRSQSFDRFRNRRNNRTPSRERSDSRGRSRGAWKKGPMTPLSPSQIQQAPVPPPATQTPNNPNFCISAPSAYPDTNVYGNNYPPSNIGGYMANQQYPNYDYQMPPLMQPPSTQYGSYPPPNVMQPVPPGDDYQSSSWNAAPVAAAPMVNRPPEPAPMPPMMVAGSAETDEEKQKREVAVALEKKNQRATLRKQRDDYKRRASALKRELKILKEQRVELLSSSEPPSPTTHGFLKENDRLQAQIENKINTIDNVIDMLCGIIGNEKSPSLSPKKISAPAREETKENRKSEDSSPERLKTKVIESLKKKKGSDRSVSTEEPKKSVAVTETERINYTFYDPELHWCKVCSVFPKTAKDYLSHLHSEEHKNNVKTPEIPWHDHIKNDELPKFPDAPTKRTPIRGLQFFVPATSWYCKMCNVWMGDLHCASSHLKSQTHANEYNTFITKNPLFEIEWSSERQRAYDTQQEISNLAAEIPPPPPIISSPPRLVPPAPSITYRAPTFDNIPLQINQNVKSNPKESSEDASAKKGKKKKKEKKRRKKSKKRRQSSSSSSSDSSDDSSDSPDERRSSIEKAIIDTSNSIRVAMRNSLQANRSHKSEKSEEEKDEDVGGKWTVIQEGIAPPIAPQPPTISANGEAQNRRDELIISQWNAPEPVITEKEKQLLEQLKDRLKNREEKKKEEPTRPPTRSEEDNQNQPSKVENERSGKTDRDRSRRDRSSSRGYDRRARERDRDRRSSTPRRNRRSRSPRRSSRSPRRFSRSPRRSSRSPRRDRRRRSRSRSRNRRIEKPIVQKPEFKPRVPESNSHKGKDADRKKSSNTDKFKSGSSTQKKSTASTTSSTKKLPFIGRMPVFKKQTTMEEEPKKQEMEHISEEELKLRQKRQDELKFQIHQKQQLVQLQQKQAEAYNLAHPGQFASAYSSHGSIHHILPPVTEEYDDLMPDPMQYVSLMGAPPPPPIAETIHIAEVHSEPVLPPGIDEEEVEHMAPLTHTAPPPKGGQLPQDFQDALSIIFDKSGEAKDPSAAAGSGAGATSTSATLPTSINDESSLSTFAPMELSSMDSQQSQPEIDHNAVAVQSIELDEQSQYMLYGSMPDKPLVFNEINSINQIQQQPQHPTTASNHSIDPLTQNIPTPPIQILDAAGNLTQIPGSVLELPTDFMMTDSDGNTNENIETEHEAELKKKRLQELEDLALLGIDAEDLAAQCI